MKEFDVIVIGLGPAGVAAAVECSQNSMKVAAIEKSDIGGTCLNRGCIPTKSLLHSAKLRRSGIQIEYGDALLKSQNAVAKIVKGLDFTLSRAGVEIFAGCARILADNCVAVKNNDGCEEIIKAENIIVCVGAKPRVPEIFRDAGSALMTSAEAVKIAKLPTEIAIIGGGTIGIEFARIWSAFGAKVTLLEIADRILPFYDADISSLCARVLKREGVNILTSAKVVGARKEGLRVEIDFEKAGKAGAISADKVLVCAGIEADFGDLFSECGALEKTSAGFPKTDENFRTNLVGIYAVGDAHGAPFLAHIAEAEALSASADIVAKKSANFSAAKKIIVPSCVYGMPEAAAVGESETSANAKYGAENIVVKKAFFAALPIAVACENSDGFAKLICAKDGTILGISVVGACAGELVCGCVSAVARGAKAAELTDTVYPHPSYAEIWRNMRNL